MKKSLTMDRPDDDEPLFASVDEMCDAFGWDDEIKAQILRDVEMTRPRDARDAVAEQVATQEWDRDEMDRAGRALRAAICEMLVAAGKEQEH